MKINNIVNKIEEQGGILPKPQQLNQQPEYLLYLKLLHIPQCNYQWFVKIKYLKYEKSHFGIFTGVEEIRIYDDKIRLSDFVRIAIPEFRQLYLSSLEEWSGNPREDFDDSLEWNSLRYVYGHFKWHIDKIRIKEGYQHYGTQIIFPPMSFERFKEGELKIINLNEELLTYIPDEEKWTYIILPLGYRHCVQKVEGIRYSFTKQIFVKKGVKLKNKLPQNIQKDHGMTELDNFDS